MALETENLKSWQKFLKYLKIIEKFGIIFRDRLHYQNVEPKK